MLKICSNRIAKFFVRNGADPEMEEVYAYGIECTLSTLLILALLIAAGFILGKPLQMLVFIAAWLPLRMLVGGAHANTHWACTLVSVGLGTVSVWLSDYINMLHPAIIITAAVICYIVFFITAPVVHKNHPISQSRYRKRGSLPAYTPPLNVRLSSFSRSSVRPLPLPHSWASSQRQY